MAQDQKVGERLALSPVRRVPDYEVVTPGDPGEVGARVRGAVSKVITRAMSEYACHLVYFTEGTVDAGNESGGRSRVTVVLACRFPEKVGPLLEQAHQWLKVAGAKRTAFRHLPPAADEGGLVEVEIEW